MASIKLQSLVRQNVEEYTYKDIHLDIKPNQNISEFGLHRESNTNDIEESRDVAAIMNSIKNIFDTVPGEKLLSPEFGANLHQYLFDPITKDTAENIGETTRAAINQFEPRVILDKVQVIMNKDAHEYVITVKLTIPSLNNKKAVMKGRLTGNGYILT